MTFDLPRYTAFVRVECRECSQCRVVALLVRELNRLRVLSLLIFPSSSSRWLSSLAVRGSDPAVSISRRSRVLALLVRAARVAVVLGLSFVVFAVERIRIRSVLVCRVLQPLWGRSPQFQPPRFGETQFRPFQQPGPSRFGQSSQPFFSGPQHAQVNTITREQAEETPSRVIGVDWAVKIRIRPPELETSICDAKYHVSLSTRSVLGKWVYLVTLAMSLFDLQDVCIAIGSIATLDLPKVVDLIGIYGLKGPYRTLTTTNWFLQALSVIPRGSWGDVARRSYHDPMGKSGIVIPEPQWFDRSYDEVSVMGMNLMFIRWTRARWSTVKCRFPCETGRSQARVASKDQELERIIQNNPDVCAVLVEDRPHRWEKRPRREDNRKYDNRTPGREKAPRGQDQQRNQGDRRTP
ncbi:hypothetical protein F511_20631 [Dorcoceras hygrometricum]|uniref:Uncharacterized protein n=1 Tax=Dorcoceras hygrometricum TaxID=472368 RepID=A0A2Z7CEV1_9LAMI|nr:hypothetical protein F511_20631 [Dorcoceras hygrometricum]